MEIIGEVSKEEFKEYLKNIDLEDEGLYDQVNKSQFGVFQFSGNTASRMVKEGKPKNFDDMVSINALSRPGASYSFDDFVSNGETNKSKYPPQIAKYLSTSRGCILFQEEVMNIIDAFCSHNNGNDARGLMKRLGKKVKKSEDLKAWDELTADFRQGCIKSGLTERQADDVSNDMLKLSAYSFNRSHAFAYSYLAMQTVYLSRYFKTFYYSSTLSYDSTKKDALKDSMRAVINDGYKIYEPDVNSSHLNFFPEENGIRFGLSQIKGAGIEPINEIIKKRPYSSIIDFIIKNLDSKGVTKRIVSALICGGAFDSLIGNKRSWYDKVSQKFYEIKKTTKTPELIKEKWDEAEKSVPDEDTKVSQYIDYENDYLGGNFFHGIFSQVMLEKIDLLVKSGKCVRDFDDLMNKKLPTRYVPVEVKSYRYHTDKNGHDMIFLNIEDSSGKECSIPIFYSYWNVCKEKFFAEGFYILSLFVNEDGKIMFGSKDWISDARKKTMMIPWRIQS